MKAKKVIATILLVANLCSACSSASSIGGESSVIITTEASGNDSATKTDSGTETAATASSETGSAAATSVTDAATAASAEADSTAAANAESGSAATNSESGSTAAASSGTDITASTEKESESKEPYKFQPHLHFTFIGDAIPEDHYESLYHLIDALLEGKDSFACSSQEAYDWATDDATLNNFFPAACIKVTGKSTDGTTPFENGTGRIYYKMPKDEFLKREAQYESDIEEILNTSLDPDDNDFEKCLKLLNYMASTFTYGQVDATSTDDGADYKALQMKTGICDHLASIYAYLLMQAGVEAYNIGIFEPDMCHAWTYAIVNGKGYHIDPTWSLKYEADSDLDLSYFMMNDQRRADSGCPLNDITAPVLPKFWAHDYESIDFKASDPDYEFPEFSTLKELDEKNKILYYCEYGDDETKKTCY